MVVDAGYEASEALKHDQTKDARIKQLGDKFEAAYNRIDTALVEMKMSLTDADTVFSLDLLNYKSGRLELLGNQIEVADSFAEALFALDLEQDTVTAESQNQRRSALEIMLEQCETIIRTKRAGIQEKLDAEWAAADQTVVDGAVALTATTTTATTAAPGKMGPKIERLPLRDFKGGQLKDYAKWKRDWKNVIGASFEPVIELQYIKEKVPAKIRDLVEGLTTMEDLWELLDEEYGKATELVND